MTLGKLIQRGFDSTIANWPLLLIRIAGSVGSTIVVLIAVVPIVLFAIYSGTMTEIESLSTAEGAIDWLIANAIVIVVFILILTLIIAVAIAIHSFITGGVAGIYLDADRQAPLEGWERRQLAWFTPDLWARHAMRNWWKIFLIYNLTWGIWSILLLLPLLPLIPMLIAATENQAWGLAGCFLIAVWFLFAFVGSILIHIWTELSILDCVRSARPVVFQSLRGGLAIFGANFGRILVLLVLMVMITIAAGSFSLAMQFGFEIGMSVDEIAAIFIPIQILFSLLQTAVSVFASAWLMACFARLTNATRG